MTTEPTRPGDFTPPSMTPAEFRRLSRLRSRPGSGPLNASTSTLALYGMGLAGEAGEVCDEVKKYLWHDKPLNRDKIISECGDVLWYLDRLLGWLDATFEDAMQANVDKLAARYPDGWDAADKHFDHGDGR